MEKKQDSKNRLSFVGNTIMREQRTSEGLRDFGNQSVLDRLNDEVKHKESIINSLNLNTAEWKLKNEDLVKENSILRAKLNQYYSQELNLASEKYQREISSYVSNELWLKGEISKLEFRNKDLGQEIVDLKRQLADYVKENKKLKNVSAENNRERYVVKRQILINLKVKLPEIKRSFQVFADKVTESLNDTKQIVFVSFTNFTQIAQSEITKLFLENKRVKTSYDIQSIECSALINKFKDQEIKISMLEELIKNYKNSILLNENRCAELENSLKAAQNTVKEQVNIEKFNKIEKELQETKEKLNTITWKNQEITEIIKKELNTMINTLSISSELETKANEDPFQAFRLINEKILHLKKSLVSYESLSTSLQSTNIDLVSQISQLKEAQKLFNLTQNPSHEHDVSKLASELAACKESLLAKEKKISSLEQREHKFQQEIKISFEKIEKFRAQILQNDQKLILIPQLQFQLKQELLQSQSLRAELAEYKKQIIPPQSPTTNKSDPAAFLLQKIELMKTELENYNPTESKQSQNPRSLKSLLEPLQMITNKLAFTIKILADDYSCKICNKLEDVEVCACGHLGCMNCCRTCNTCQKAALNTSIFFRLSRRVRDLQLCESQIKEYLSVISN